VGEQQLPDLTPPLNRSSDVQVQQLKSQLCDACMFNTHLTSLIEQKDAKMQLMKDHFTQMKTKLQVGVARLTCK
jgi:hypothetical protein